MRLECFAGIICRPSLILAGIQQISENVPNAYHEFSAATSAIRPIFSRLVRPIWLWATSLIPIQVLKSESSALAPAQGGIYAARYSPDFQRPFAVTLKICTASKRSHSRPISKIFSVPLGVKLAARISKAVGEIRFRLSRQKLTTRSGFPLSTTRRKSLIGADGAPAARS
jgi:hypothetical protein